MSYKSADTIESELRQRIGDGFWAAGARVATERDLAVEFGAARNTVRRALTALVDEGLLVRQVGRGTFVRAGSRPAGGNQLAFRLREASPAEIMEVRMVIEPQIAALAATRASSSEIQAIEDVLRQSLMAKGLAEFEQWDARLHLALVLAARNPLLADLCRAINEARNQPQWYSLKKRSVTPERRALYDRHHSAIVAAIRSRHAEQAAEAMREHLRCVNSNLFDAVM
jgi:DNA-binding FadR family transcriptional regulator